MNNGCAEDKEDLFRLLKYHLTPDYDDDSRRRDSDENGIDGKDESTNLPLQLIPKQELVQRFDDNVCTICYEKGISDEVIFYQMDRSYFETTSHEK